MGWIYVLIAAIAELTGVVGLNKFNEKKTIPHTLMFFGGFAAAFVFLYASFNSSPTEVSLFKRVKGMAQR